VNKLGLNRRLWFALKAMWVGLVTLGVYGAIQTRSIMLERRKPSLKNVVEVTARVTASYEQQSTNLSSRP
jgi:methyl-accepting chemotaxis protein